MQGSTTPRLYTKPLRKLTPKTSLGYAAIEYAKTVLKKNLYPWQEWALIHLLEITGSLQTQWAFRFRVIVIMVSRQNGKTVLSEVLASFFLNVLGVECVFGTSLSLDKAEEVWEAVINDQEGVKSLSQSIAKNALNSSLIRLHLKTAKVRSKIRNSG